MKRVVFIISLFSTALLFAQVPKNIKENHFLLDSIYEGSKSLKVDSLKVITNNMQTFYDSITEYYRYYGAKKKILKGVRFYTDNDLLSFSDNRDHEYTGGFRLELITDYFGTKILSFRRDHKYLSYQSILFGFELYTPDVLNVEDVEDLDKNDRPFASFQYFGRSRNIL